MSHTILISLRIYTVRPSLPPTFIGSILSHNDGERADHLLSYRSRHTAGISTAVGVHTEVVDDILQGIKKEYDCKTCCFLLLPSTPYFSLSLSLSLCLFLCICLCLSLSSNPHWYPLLFLPPSLCFHPPPPPPLLLTWFPAMYPPHAPKLLVKVPIIISISAGSTPQYSHTPRPVGPIAPILWASSR